ncbi:synaptotagmin-14b isoform X2 [Syngnathus acus]|uniref:synaptotagmin-14b isoform X2 n=1 Tax=Syngnathus acus TaxID=161584 RepID=UPI001885FF16|nr:synaptotagmin-14b isoform X2 [Syngnathus acus]
MAFFKSFQQNLPTVNISSILDSVSSKVDDLANAVSDVTYAVSDQLTEQVNTIINKVQEEEDVEQESTTQDGKSGSRSTWMETTSLKNNQSNEAVEAEYAQSQLEWEWKDGCWRVKKTEAEIAEEERRKKEEKELLEMREQRRKERRERRLEKAGEITKNEELSQEPQEEDTEAEEFKKTEEVSQGEDAIQPSGPEECDEPSGPESERRVSDQEEEKNKRDEEDKCSFEREGDDEEMPDASKAKVKKKKMDKKKEKAAKKAEKEAKKKEKGKKRKKKEESKQEAVLTDSEEDRKPEPAVRADVTALCKEVTEQEGYSSEASSEHASIIQKIKKAPSLTEGQPPPYQDRVPVTRVSSSRGRRGSSPQRCSSEASVDQDTESYLNKGCEEDIPSDSTAVVGPEDSSGPLLPSAYEPEPLAKYGTLDVAFEYDSNEQWLAVTVTAATDIPALKQTGNISWQVHLVLLPTKKQRAKTGVQKGPCPVFTETFKFSRVEQEALSDCAVRFRLYSIRRMKKEKVLGEKVFYLTKLNLQGKMALPVTLEPGSELTGCGSIVSVSRSGGAVSYRSAEDTSSPEILLGLVYNSVTGHLSAEVIQGSHFKSTPSDKPVNGLFCCIKHFVGGQLYIMRGKNLVKMVRPDFLQNSNLLNRDGDDCEFPSTFAAVRSLLSYSLSTTWWLCPNIFLADTYVTLTMLDSKGKEMSKFKTAVCRGQPSPAYKETFVFHVALFQLSDVSLVLSVFCRRSTLRPRERLGWVSLGHSSTGEEQLAHWTEMKEAEGQQCLRRTGLLLLLPPA